MNATAEATIAKIESEPGYHYDRQKVIDICDAGIDAIEDGTVIGRSAGIRMTVTRPDVVATRVDSGEIVSQKPIAGNEDHIVTMYAMRMSRLGHTCGTMA